MPRTLKCLRRPHAVRCCDEGTPHDRGRLFLQEKQQPELAASGQTPRERGSRSLCAPRLAGGRSPAPRPERLCTEAGLPRAGPASRAEQRLRLCGTPRHARPARASPPPRTSCRRPRWPSTQRARPVCLMGGQLASGRERSYGVPMSFRDPWGPPPRTGVLCSVPRAFRRSRFVADVH